MTSRARRLLAEFLGTALLVCIVVGSGIAAQQLSPHNRGLQLLECSLATAVGLAVLVLVFGPISGAHLNPIVSVVDWWRGRAGRNGLTAVELRAYVIAQVAGAGIGAVLANAMFDLPLVQVSDQDRVAAAAVTGEVVATAGLIVTVFALDRISSAPTAAAGVGGYLGVAYWFTGSTTFANPAMTIGRIYSDTFTGIAPSSVPSFVLAQMVGGLAGLALITALASRAAGERERVRYRIMRFGART